MGCFSWFTQDNNDRIVIGTGPWYMVADNGKQWREDNYEGYGVFGGKDFYVLLNDMNPQHPDYSTSADPAARRMAGISIRFDGNAPFWSPNLNTDPGRPWVAEAPKEDPDQGFEEYDEDDDDDDWGQL